jgi:hypothetical protein
LAGICAAQDDNPNVPAASVKYHQYRLEITEPVWGLKKVEAMIKAIKPTDDDSQPLTTAKFNSLSVDEKFTFTMIHGEAMDQNCDPMPGIVGEERMIFGQLPGNFDYTMAWSDRQEAFLKNNRAKVIALIRATMKNHPHVGLNLKHAIVEVDAYEMIPDIIKAFNRNKKDLDMLTTLFLLMKDGKYKPFLESETFKKCYGPNADYKASVDGNEANQKLTIQRAEAFYKTR